MDALTQFSHGLLYFSRNYAIIVINSDIKYLKINP